MINRKSLLLSGCLLATLTPFLMHGTALADQNDRQVWRDSDDQIVHNSWGQCVRSDWDIGVDLCAPPVTISEAVHTVIAQEDRTIYFAFNKADLTPEAKEKLDSLAGRITAASDIRGAQVVGYADRIGTASYNEKLSKKRAMRVRDYLVAHNILNTSVAQTRWVGKSEPTASCAADLPHAQLIQCLAPDRKVQVEIVYNSETVSENNVRQ